MFICESSKLYECFLFIESCLLFMCIFSLSAFALLLCVSLHAGTSAFPVDLHWDFAIGRRWSADERSHTNYTPKKQAAHQFISTCILGKLSGGGQAHRSPQSKCMPNVATPAEAPCGLENKCAHCKLARRSEASKHLPQPWK